MIKFNFTQPVSTQKSHINNIPFPYLKRQLFYDSKDLKVPEIPTNNNPSNFYKFVCSREGVYFYYSRTIILPNLYKIKLSQKIKKAFIFRSRVVFYTSNFLFFINQKQSYYYFNNFKGYSAYKNTLLILFNNYLLIINNKSKKYYLELELEEVLLISNYELIGIYKNNLFKINLLTNQSEHLLKLPRSSKISQLNLGYSNETLRFNNDLLVYFYSSNSIYMYNITNNTYKCVSLLSKYNIYISKSHVVLGKKNYLLYFNKDLTKSKLVRCKYNSIFCRGEKMYIYIGDTVYWKNIVIAKYKKDKAVYFNPFYGSNSRDINSFSSINSFKSKDRTSQDFKVVSNDKVSDDFKGTRVSDDSKGTRVKDMRAIKEEELLLNQLKKMESYVSSVLQSKYCTNPIDTKFYESIYDEYLNYFKEEEKEKINEVKVKKVKKRGGFM